MTVLRFTAPTPPITADVGRRRLRGPVLPWDTDAVVSSGQRVRFLPGSVDMTGAPVVLHHDEARPIGKVLAARSTDTAHEVDASVSDVSDGDTALILAADGVLTGWSVGVEPTEAEEVDGVLVVTAAESRHLALVVSPAFGDASRVTEVAASATTPHDPAEPTGPAATPTTEVSMSTTTTDPTPVAADPTPPAPVAVPADVTPAPRSAVTVAASVPTPGEYVLAMLNRRSEPERFANMAAAIRAAGHTTTTDTPGIIPEFIVGQLVRTRPDARPIMDAFGPLAGPAAGKKFTRPKVSDPLADAAAAAEKSDVTDTLGITAVEVTYEYVKRAANISAEDVAFTAPGIIEAVLAELATAYLRGTEKVAATTLEGGTYTSTTYAANGSDIVDTLYAGAATIYNAVGTLPDTLVCAVDVWAKFGGFMASDGRPVFPVLGPSNAAGDSAGASAFGINPLGLRLIPSWALTAGAAFLAASPLVETYEAHRASMRADEPTVMGTAVSIGGAAALAVLDTGGVVELTSA